MVLPDGSLLVLWKDLRQGAVVGRQSEDGGGTFGPEFLVASCQEPLIEAPGYREEQERLHPFHYLSYGLQPDFISVAVDRSGGPRTGTVYVVYAERAVGRAVDVDRSVGELEPNDTQETATPIEIGSEFRGKSISPDRRPGGDYDYFRFEGKAGQMVAFDGWGAGGDQRQENYPVGFFVSGVDEESNSFPVGHGTVSRQLDPWKSPEFVFSLPRDGTYYIHLLATWRYDEAYSIRLREFIPDAGSVSRDQRDIVMVSSTDGGRTWTPKVRINDDAPGRDNQLPVVGVDRFGRVISAWIDRREDPRGVFYNIYGTVSSDGGRTFSANQRLNETQSEWHEVAFAGDRLELQPKRDGMLLMWPQMKWDPDRGSDDGDLHYREIRVEIPEIEIGVKAVESAEAVELNWQGQPWDLISGYEVLRSVEDGPWEPMARFDGLWATRGEGTYRDASPVLGRRNRYSVRATRLDGAEMLSEPAIGRPRPLDFRWGPPHPNPTSGIVEIDLYVPESNSVRVNIMDIQGRQIRNLHDGALEGGKTPFRWDGRDNAGAIVPEGIYFIHAASRGSETRAKITRAR